MKRSLQVVREINLKEFDERFEMFKVNPERDEMLSSFVKLHDQLEKEGKLEQLTSRAIAAWEKINQ
jgi:hypothetical protein